MVSAATMLGLQMIPNFALLYGGHLMVSTLREALLNGDKLERSVKTITWFRTRWSWAL